MQKRKMGSIVCHRKRLMKENDVAFSGTWQHKTSGMDVSGVLFLESRIYNFYKNYLVKRQKKDILYKKAQMHI